MINGTLGVRGRYSVFLGTQDRAKTVSFFWECPISNMQKNMFC